MKASQDAQATSSLAQGGRGSISEPGTYESNTVRKSVLLRALTPADEAVIYWLAGSLEVGRTMISIPHPLPKAFAESFVSGGVGTRFGIYGTDNGLVGAIELRDIDPEHRQAELSFWIGRPYWNRGYAVEAGRLMLRHAFSELKLNRVYAHHMAINPVSGRVLSKLGMRQEGLLRQRVLKAGRFEDVLLWAVLKEDPWRSDEASEQRSGNFIDTVALKGGEHLP